MNKRKIVIILIVGSVLIWVIDRFTLIISSAFGALRCGDRYLQPMPIYLEGRQDPLEGFVSDLSCGFNDDMYLVVLLFVVLLVGVVLCLTARTKK